jgi:DNA sulfur modification protein DndE
MKLKINFYIFALLAPLMTLQAINEKEAEEIGTEVYIYGYPLVTSEITRRVMTNTVKPEGQRAPMNQFINLKTFPDPSYKDFTTPNADTLYSFAWIDLSTEPLVLYLPDEDNRYYLMPFLSAWTDVFAVPGTRTTGDKPGNFAITGPRWKGTLPPEVQQLKSPTDLVFVIGRTYCDGTKEDYAKVSKLQDQYTLTPLSSFGKPYTPPPGKVNSKIDLKTPVRDQVNNLDAATFFQTFAALLNNNPPAYVDAPMVAQMAKIGIVPGKEFDLSKQSAAVVKGLANVPKIGLAKIMAYQKVATTTING